MSRLIIGEDVQLVANADGEVVLHLPVYLEDRTYQYAVLSALAGGRPNDTTRRLADLLTEHIDRALSAYLTTEA